MKVATVVGARPQFIKAAVLSPELEGLGIGECLIHTGQHYDYNMSRGFFVELKIREPDYFLEVGSAPHGLQTGEMMKRLEPLLEKEEPDWVLVYGDTNTTLAAALVAAKLQRRLVHVEAGLRSFDKAMPEEINRIVTDHLATLLFAPTANAAQNLKREGIHDGVCIVGDLMVDLAMKTASSLPSRPDVLSHLDVQPKQFAFATIHRAANTDDVGALRRILMGLERLNLPVVLPAHPRIKRQLHQLRQSLGLHNLRVCEPVTYTDSIALQLHARVVLTDSGGIQKESYVLGTPCVTLRHETEWTETLADGWNVLAGQDPQTIAKVALREKPHRAPVPVYGVGQAGIKIAETISAYKNSTERLAAG